MKEAKLVAGVVSPIPTGRKDCGGRQGRQTPANYWQGVPRYLWEEKNIEGTNPPKALDVLDTRDDTALL